VEERQRSSHDGGAERRERLAAAESRAEDLERALLSNRRIGLAIGILMASLKITEERAFDLLREPAVTGTSS
jgi:AmiR/NasT family two-component response regulator